MNRRLLVTLAVATASASALSLPSQAAVKAKPKPKPIKGSYTVTLLPDPSKEATTEAGMDGCSGLSPAAVDRHAFTAPAAGTLTVHLSSPNPAGSTPAGFDWDLYTYDASGLLSSSDGATGTEETVDGFKKKTPVTIEVCNLDGEPSATVTYTFTYK